MRHIDDLSHALGGNTLYERDRDSMLAERANESFDSLARLIHDTGVVCNLPAYPIDSTWTFTYKPYSTGDESGLAAETDQAKGTQLGSSSTWDDRIIDFKQQGNRSGSRGKSPNNLPPGGVQRLCYDAVVTLI